MAPLDSETGGKYTSSAQKSTEQVLASAKSTADTSRLSGETYGMANARITQAYKDLQAKPVLSQEQVDAGAKVQYVRTGAGGVGEYTVVVPPGYTGPRVTTDFTEGVIRSDLKYTTVSGKGGVNTGTGNTGAVKTNTKGLPDGNYTIIGRKAAPDGNGTVVTYKDSATGKTYDIVEYPQLGDNTGSKNTSNTGASTLSASDKDAYAILEDAFRSYGLSELVPAIEGYMKNNLGPEQAKLKLKTEQAYKDRFIGNQQRLAKGQNVLSEAEYINLENSYVSTLNAYGLSGFFGTDRKAQVAAMGNIIGGDVSATEFAGRVQLVVDEVKNSDPMIKAQLKNYYNIDDADLVNYYLNPSQNLASLKQKTLSAEIGAAAANQGIGAGVGTAEMLAKQGITQAQAQQGYKAVADILPTSNFLSSIYKEAGIDYGQSAVEADVFGTKDAASAQRKRKQLQQLEAGSFSAQSGINPQYSGIGRSIQGAF